MSKNTIDPAPKPSCFAFLAACLASVIPSSFAPDWRVDASRPLASSTNPNPCASNVLFFPVHVLCVSLGGAVSQYPENENVLRSTGRAAFPGYSFRSNPKYTFLSAGTLTLLSSSNGELGRAARTDSSATMMVKLVVMRFIRKDYHYVLVNSVRVHMESAAKGSSSNGRERDLLGLTSNRPKDHRREPNFQRLTVCVHVLVMVDC